MNIKLLHIALILSLCAALAACSDTDALVDDPSTGKTPIELSVGGVDAQEMMTRAVISSDQGKTMHAFPTGSSIYMLFMANETGGSGFKTTRTIGFAQDQNPATTLSDISFTASNEGNKFVRYWDDAYARKTALSIAAVSTPGYGPSAAGASTADSKAWSIGGQTGFQDIAWTAPGSGGIESSTYIDWPVGNHSNKGDQSVESPNFITYQDLCFSNNIGDNSQYDLGNTRIKFDPEIKKFGKGTLIFNHALSKLTFRIKKGEGFTDNEFKFNDGTNIKLSNFYKSGRFIIGTGEFTKTAPNAPVKDDIAKINLRTTPESGDKFTLDALVVPGTDMTSSDDAVTFYINHNEYKLTMEQLYAAFTDEQKNNYFDTGKLKAGVHYVFTFTVSKTQIGGITAQIVPWETVEASNLNPSNAQITLQLENRGSAISNDVNVYRSAETASTITTDITSESGKGYVWDKGYGDANLYDYDNTTKKLQTSWYWPDNQTFYHFRAVAPTSLAKKTDNNKEYVELSALENTSATSTPSYTDVTWGAPFKDIDASAKLSYSASTGFDATTAHQIHPAIGTTDSEVKLLMFHMMSDVTIKVESVSGDGAVQLGDGNDGNCTTIKLAKIYKSGKVYLGNGLVEGVLESGATAKGDYSFTSHPAPNSDGVITWANYGAIPQDLGGATPSDATDDVILVITTPDNNEYRVTMKDVLASSVSSNNIANPYTAETVNSVTKYKIDRWYPGFQYTYTFKLSKKKIESITATILDWEKIEAGDDNVQIK